MKPKSKFQFIVSMFLAVIFFPFYSYGAKNQIEIKSSKSYPIHINAPGSYLVVENIEVSTDSNCIQINVPGVILDLGGHTLTGTSSGDGTGIYSGHVMGSTVINGTIRNFGKDGIRLAGKNCEVRDVKAHGNGGDGIYVGGGVMINCATSDNGGYGIHARNASVTNCTANENAHCGIAATLSSLTNCTSNENSVEVSGDDLALGGICASYSSVTNCSANSNAGNIGIIANRGTIINCVANGNNTGIIGDAHSTITNCTAANNTENGIVCISSTITNSRADENTVHGIYAYTNCRMEGNYVSGGEYGIYLSGSDNYVIKNVASNYDSTHGFISDSTINYMPTNDDLSLDVNANYRFE